MAWNDDFLISGFSDEICRDKDLRVQLEVSAALGLQAISLRFVNLGNGVQNLMSLTDDEAMQVAGAIAEQGLVVASLGTPLGKVRLSETEDGSGNLYRSPEDYLDCEVERVCRLAQIFKTRRIRGFSFYHPVGSDPARHLERAIQRLEPIAKRLDTAGLTLGLEVEANLVGQNGELMAGLHRGVNHPALVLVFDAGNLVTQGYSTGEILQQFDLMSSGLGWVHVKDSLPESQPSVAIDAASGSSGRRVDEESLNRFVPAGQGSGGYQEVLRRLQEIQPDMRRRLEPRGIEDTLVDLEPHVAGGGQFGGFSGALGFGRSLRALTRLLDRNRIGYRLRG